jgi:cell division septation protein DedD
MRGVFDEREAERSRRRRSQEGVDEEQRDREVTLGSFTLLAILFGLVVLCGLSFSLGYLVGQREPVTQSTLLEPKPIAAQGESWKSKPSGGSGSGSANAAADAAPSSEADGQMGASDSGDASAASDAAGGKGAQKGAQSELGGDRTQPVPPPASDLIKSSPAVAKPPQQTQSKSVQATIESAERNVQTATPLALMVQIATLAHEEDADVLVDALRRRGYAVTAHRDLADGMVHVRIGPFTSRDVANQWRQKLLNDGYNAAVESQ